MQHGDVEGGDSVSPGIRPPRDDAATEELLRGGGAREGKREVDWASEVAGEERESVTRDEARRVPLPA